MKRKLLFITLLMLFCTTMFGQQHWTMTNTDIVKYNLHMTVFADIKIGGETPDNISDIEIAAFHDGILRGVAKPVYKSMLGQYIAELLVYGNDYGDNITFKVFDPNEGNEGKEYDTDYVIEFQEEDVGLSLYPVEMNFYSMHWSYINVNENYMAYPCIIKIDGVEQTNPNLELAAFINNELRGVARPKLEEAINIYIANLMIDGENGETISFKLYVPELGELETDYTAIYDIDYDNGLVTIDFRNEAVAQIGDTYYKTLADAFAAVQNNQTITLITDVELSSAISFTKDITFTIDGDGKTIKPAEGSIETNSAFNLGQGNDGTVATRIYTIKNIVFDGWTTDHVVRLQGVNATVEGCTFQNCNQADADALGLLTLTFCEAKVKDCDFIDNTCVKAIDINSWGDGSEKNATIEECVFDNNECNTTAVVYRHDGEKLVVKDSKFLNNKVNATGNAATLYAGWATNDVITGCYFANNTVTTSHATTIRFASAIFCDGCTVTGNAFENNTATRNGETITTTVAVGAYYGAANVSENYWGKENPVAGTDYTVEYPNKDVAFNSYYKSYSDTEGLTDLVELNNVAKVGKYYYTSLAEAFAAVQNGETVKLLTDLTLVSETTDSGTTDPETTYTIADGKSVTLDMNGKKITVTDNKTTTNYELFYIYGGLTVTGDGTIELTATNDRDWNAMSAIFHNRGGVLTINNGTFKHLGGTDMAYVVDNSGNYYGDATTNINNGTLASTYIAIRNRMEQNTHGASGKAILNVYGGTINGERRAIWAQAASTSETAPATGEINISGGNIGLIETDRSTGAVSMTTISGGTVTEFKGEVNELKVTGGTLNDVTIMDASGNEIDYAVNKDGLYVAAVAKIGDKGYVSIQAAVNEAQDGNTVIVKEGKYNVFCPADSDDNYTDRAHNLFVGKSITIKGEEGKEVVIYSYQETYTTTFDARITLLISGSDGVVIDNLTILPCYYPATITTDLSTVTGSEINALVGADNLKYYYNQIIDAMRNYNGTGQVSKNYIANITVKNCTIGDEAIPAENWGSAIYYPGAVGNATNFVGLTGGYTIENNVLFGGICICEGAAKDATTETCIIKNNTIHGGLFLNGKRPTGWNYVSLTVFPTVTGNTFTQAAGNTDGHAWFISSRDGDEGAVISTQTLEAYLANNTFTVASDKKAKVVVGSYAYSAEATEYYGLVSSEFIVDGEGTENNPYIITNLHELEAFRDAVNAGNDFSGKVFELNGDINLAATRAINNWEPIGTQANPFKGTFDGDNKTISNLVVEGENNVGLFGYATSATIKNVKLENVNVKGTDCVGAIAGQVYSTSLIDNCHVSGSIQVEGQTNVGGIVGKYYTKVKNCSVIGDDVATSYVKGTHKAENFEGDNIGGIMGHGGENNRFENNTVKNITISGTRKVAGIVGVTDMNTQVKNCVVEDVNIVTTATAEYANSKKNTMSNGTLVGSYTTGNNTTGTVESCVVKNVNFLNPNNAVVSVGPITGGLRGGTDGMLAPTGVTASNNNIYMSTITGSNNLFLMNPVAKIGTTEYYTLFDAVAAVQDGETITMLRNTAEEFAIDNTTANITLDMAGFTLTGAITPSKANLTIKNGTINNENASYSAIEINAGTLVLNDVKVTSKRHGVRIDGTVTATINGGEYGLSATSGTRHAVNVSGGADVTIKAGTFVGPAGTSMDSGSAVCVQADAIVTIEGGDFSGGKNHTLSADGTLTVKGGTFDQVVNVSHLAVGYFCELNTTTNKYEVFRGLAGEGTEANPYLIKNLSDLVFFRDHVNAGETRYNATGVWVALANDIDMTDIANWTPIGNVTYDSNYKPTDASKVFVGVFNGNGKVISDLKVASTVGGVDTQANVGLFGITGDGAGIKDLTLTNVNIETDGRNVGALAGFAYKATLSNITVNGNIQIKGGNNVSGVAGMTRHHAMSATNIAVKGNDGSVIEGNNIVGGIFAEIAPNGSLQKFENLSIENVAINGVGGVGGIVGLLTLGTVENVSVKNVVLTGRTDYQGNAMGRIRLGSVAGLMGGNYATIINPTVENVTAKNLDGNDVVLPIIGANYDASSNATEARIGDTYYATLKHAIAAAQANETTIVMIADAEVSETVRVEAGQKITLDLNGKTIDGTEKVGIALMSYGDLTIKDSTEEKNGMIKAGIGTAGNTVNICKGTFTLESGNIYSKNNAILIDEQTATVNINGGTITAEPTTNNSAAFYISSTSDTEVNITAGTMKGFNGILLWNNTKINITGGSVIAEGDLAIQGNGSRDNTEINISGENTIITGKDAAIYHPQGGKLNISGGTITGSTGIVVKGGEVTISGGTINGTGEAVAYEPVSSGYKGTGDALYVEHYDNSTDSGNYGTPVVTVTGGTFNSTNAHPIASYANPNNASNGVEALANFISGGIYNKSIPEELVASGFECKENADGTYGVRFAGYIVLPSFMNENNYEDYFGTNTVTDGTNYYATLQAAVEAVVGQPAAILYCKPGADVGSLQHAPVTNTLTVYGNDAFVSGGPERDFDLGNTDPSFGQDITSDMTLTVKYLDGCGAWGAKATEHTVNLVFENCHNMGKVFVTGTTGTLNITMNNCAFEGVISEALYSNADGTIALTDVAFSNLNKAINLNHKAAGTQTVTMTRCTFTNCGNDVAADQIPVRVLSSVPGGKSELTVENCTFTGTPAGGADILLDYGVGLTEATITETNAKVVIERKNNEPEVHNVVDTQEYSFNNLPFVAEVDGTQFTSLQAAIDAADGKTVVVLDNITLTETVTVAAGTTVTLDLNGKNLTGGANVNLVIIGELIIEDNVGNAVSTFRNHYVSEGGKLTLKSGILQNIETNTGGYGIFIENGGESIIEGGTVQAVNESNYAICVNGTLTIVDGNIVGKHGVIAVENPNAIVTIKDGEYTLNAITGNSDHIVYVYAGMVNIEGGNFTFNNFIANEGDSMIDADKENVSITGGTYTHDVNEYCHEYYDAIQGADNLWRVEQVLFAQTTALHQGWNWYSSYVNLSTPDGLEKLQTALGGKGVIIKSNINNEFVTYEELPNGEFGWVGNEFSIYYTKMYMIETSDAHEMTVAGEVVDGTGTMFMLTPGWNWIGYPIDKVQNIDVALSGLQDKAQANDMIKHRNDFAYFDASTKKWVGTLTQLEPGKGYKYKSNKSSMFFYTKSDAKETVVDNAIIDENYWKVESSGYANNMTITAMLSIDGEIVNDNYEIAAFANGECRGSARPIYVESKNAYMLFMTVFGDDVEELTFKYYDIDTDTEYELSNVMNYSNDAIVGTIDNPYIFSMNILGIGENSIDNINIYPNPTTTDREINLQAICDKVEVFNALGVKVAEYHNVDTLDAFETAGIYVIRITNDNAVKHCRLVVK